MNELQTVIEEITRIALEEKDIRSRIGNELDLSDEYLEEVLQSIKQNNS